ncbi:major tail structural protein [Caudoviricetes sp.]|nr:major tail structural protein [Caudoviricetes sp.]
MTKRSNITALYITEEVANSLGSYNPVIAPLTGSDVWQGFEPNSYSDTGAEIKTVQRQPIDPGRQDKKGTIVDLDAKAGFSTDVTRTNLAALMQGFFYADAREQPATKPVVGSSVTITGVTATYNAATGLIGFNVPNALVFMTGFGVAANNGLKKVTSSTASALTVTPAPTTEASPPAASEARIVGKEFASGDLSITVSGGIATLASAANALPTNLVPGQWIYIGGDLAANQFATCPRGWARLRTVSASAYVLDLTVLLNDAAPVTDAGAGKTMQIFFGSMLKNEVGSLIKRRSYQIERQLDQTSLSAEYLIGCVPNEAAITIPGQDKVSADLSFVAIDQAFQTGSFKAGTRVAALAQDAVNTSSDVRFSKLCISPNGAGSSTSSALFAFASEINISINNNNEPSKAVGKLGAIDVHEGNFQATGSLTAYFESTAALSAVRTNADVGFASAFVTSGKQAGFLLDIPLLQLGNGQLQIEKDADMMVPLDLAGVQNAFGFTASWQTFYYLPAVA